MSTTQAEAVQEKARPSRSLAAWPIRRKLTALVAIPLVVILATGAYIAYGNIQALREAQHNKTVSEALLLANQALTDVQAEALAAIPTKYGGKTSTDEVTKLRGNTDAAVTELIAKLKTTSGTGWTSDVLTSSLSFYDASDRLSTIREGADQEGRAPTVTQSSYSKIQESLTDLIDDLARDLAVSAADGTIVDAASALAALAHAESAASQETVALTIAFVERRLSDTKKEDVRQLIIEQENQLDIADFHAPQAIKDGIFELNLTDSQIDNFRNTALTELTADPTEQGETTYDAATYRSAAGVRLDTLSQLVTTAATYTKDQATASVKTALIDTAVAIGLSVVTVLVVALSVASIARSIIVPMRRLRSGAVEAAAILPAVVRRIETEGLQTNVNLPAVLPAGQAAGPETLEVAHAVDGLAAEAIRLASLQVRLRHALDEAFVSMSRRSQSMVEKQLSIIDELESTEEDPEQLRNLFRLDHLAARMRRYNDNLLVLAGSNVRTRSNVPVAISDVFRAATSEMEQYERVRLQPVAGASVSGPVAAGLIHLLAELLDNAAMYSPPSSPILLTAAFTPEGGLHLEVSDSGVGIPPAEMSELNDRLTTQGTIDLQVPSRMGLFVVARLAQRSNFQVRLTAQTNGSGTVAQVAVPPEHTVGGPKGAGGQAPGTPMLGGLTSPAPAGPAALTSQSAPGSQLSLSNWRIPNPTQAPATSREFERITDAPQPTAQAGQPQAAFGFQNQPPAPQQPPATPPNPLNAPLNGQVNGQANGHVNGQLNSHALAADPSNRTSAGLPSRVPGAALSSNPLAANPLAQPAQPAQPTPPPAAQPPRREAPGGVPTPPPFGVTPVGSFDAFGSGAPTTEQPPVDTQVRSALRTPSAQNPFTMRRAVDPATGEPVGTPAHGIAPFSPEAFNGTGRTAAPSSAPASDGAGPAGLPRRVPGSTPTPGTPPASARAGGSQDQSDGSVFGTPAGGSTDGSGDARPGAAGLLRRTPGASLPTALNGDQQAQRPASLGGVSAPAAWDPELPSALARSATGETPRIDGDAPSDQGRTPTVEVRTSEGGAGSDPAALPPMPTPAPKATPPGVAPVETFAPAAPAAARPTKPSGELIGTTEYVDEMDTAIFDSISAWFADPLTTPSPATASGSDEEGSAPTVGEDAGSEPQGKGRDTRQGKWALLGDQGWLAASARAAAEPEVGGDTRAGLPMRRPGANLVVSASQVVPASPPSSLPARPAQGQTNGPSHRANPESVRGRLGSYQRGVASARRARQGLAGPASEPTSQAEGNVRNGQMPEETGGEQ